MSEDAEDTTIFLYFFCFMFGIAIIPTTYFLWPFKSKKSKLLSNIQMCNCEGCDLKRRRSEKLDSFGYISFIIKGLVLLSLWLLFLITVYYTFTQESTIELYDPWKEMELETDSPRSIVKKKYRELSLLYHPDRPTGNKTKFMAIAKAYEILKTPESYEDFLRHGLPDSRQPTKIVFALPNFFSDKKYSVWIILVYGLCFLILLPSIVGVWWYRSSKYDSNQILSETSQMFGYCLHTYPQNNFQRVKMILMCACEFSPVHSKKFMPERPEDEKYLPILAAKLPQAKHKINLKPFNIPFTVKARILLQAYLERLELEPPLTNDLEYILSKCPLLWEHLINVCTEMMAYFKYQRSQTASSKGKNKRHGSQKSSKGPNLETLENILKFGALLTQRLPEYNMSPLLQLPHVDEDDFKHFTTRKRRVRTLSDFATLSEEERRKLLRRLSDEQYENVNFVLSGLPKVEMQVEIEVIDIIDKKRVTPGALVTVHVFLQRTSMFFELGSNDIHQEGTTIQPEEIVVDMEFEKNKFNEVNKKIISNNASGLNKKLGRRKKVNKSQIKSRNINHSRASHLTSEDLLNLDTQYMNSDKGEQETTGSTGDIDEDKEFDILQKTILKKDKNKPVSSADICSPHVHCPNFPGSRNEGWWLYMSDPITKTLTAAPKFIPNLINTVEYDLKFQAPLSTGNYQYEVFLISDCYIGLNCKRSCLFTVYSASSIPEKFDYGLDEIDKDDEYFIEREETTSTEDTDSDDSGVEN